MVTAVVEHCLPVKILPCLSVRQSQADIRVWIRLSGSQPNHLLKLFRTDKFVFISSLSSAHPWELSVRLPLCPLRALKSTPTIISSRSSRKLQFSSFVKGLLTQVLVIFHVLPLTAIWIPCNSTLYFSHSLISILHVNLLLYLTIRNLGETYWISLEISTHMTHW